MLEVKGREEDSENGQREENASSELRVFEPTGLVRRDVCRDYLHMRMSLMIGTF